MVVRTTDNRPGQHEARRIDHRARRPGRDARRGLPVAAIASTVVALLMALVVAPEDAVQGAAQRLMYVHVPVAWTAYLCFAAVLFSSVAYLRTRRLVWDRRARALAEVGVILTALTLVTGGIWGELTWGTWWTWDARLITTAALLMVYTGQLAVRHVTGSTRRGAGLAAVIGVLGFLMVPVVHFSVLWWRTLHQPPTILGPSTAPPIHPLMAAALASAVMAVTLVAAWAVEVRYLSLNGRAAP